MKPLFLFSITLFIFSLFSCSKDKKVDSGYYPQNWQLVKMTGQIPNSEVSGQAMEWQESYQLNSDGTFTKSRKKNGSVTEATGTFAFSDSQEGKFLILTYPEKNDIIGSCYAEPSEQLWLKSEDKLLGTWSYCDGPGLEYKRIK